MDNQTEMVFKILKDDFITINNLVESKMKSLSTEDFLKLSSEARTAYLTGLEQDTIKAMKQATYFINIAIVCNVITIIVLLGGVFVKFI